MEFLEGTWNCDGKQHHPMHCHYTRTSIEILYRDESGLMNMFPRPQLSVHARMPATVMDQRI